MPRSIIYRGQKYTGADENAKTHTTRNDLDYKRVFYDLKDEIAQANRKSESLYAQINSVLNKVNPLLQLDPDKMNEEERKAFEKKVEEFDRDIDRKVDSLRKQMEAVEARLEKLFALRPKISKKAFKKAS